MKQIIFILITLGLVAGCAKKDAAPDEAKSEGKAESKSENAWKAGRNENGESVVTLDTNTQARIQLKVESPAAAQLQPEVKGFGRVLDPAPLVAAVAEIQIARAAAKTSSQELERLKNLAAQNNASARALEAAEAAATRDQAAAESAEMKLALDWGKIIANRNDLPPFVNSLASLETALVRVDLPAGEVLPSPPVSAQLFLAGDESHPVGAEFLDEAVGVDPPTQGRGFLFLVKNRPAGFSPGAAVTASVQIPGEPLGGVTVPRNAILRKDGATWIFLQTGENDFTRRKIDLDRATGAGWFVRGNLKPDDRIVTVGAQTLLSQELSAGGFQSGDRD